MKSQSKADCPRCKANTISMNLTPPMIDGFGIQFKACSACNYQMNEEDVKQFFESIKAK